MSVRIPDGAGADLLHLNVRARRLHPSGGLDRVRLDPVRLNRVRTAVSKRADRLVVLDSRCRPAPGHPEREGQQDSASTHRQPQPPALRQTKSQRSGPIA